MGDKNLTRKELIRDVAYRNCISIRKARLIVDSVFYRIAAHFYAGGDRVSLHGFGVFKRRSRKAFQGRNPATGKPIEISARESICFKPGKDLREMMN